ncbi:MAG: hypothetical protein SFY68_13420, partial [Candidatus Sumerlaeia bacterium]|nr:hypothetical protein [Candidatus Sumerlaeia bacterium]
VMLVLAGAFCFVLPTHHLQSLLTLAVPLALITPGLLLVLSRQSFLRVPRWILPIGCGSVFLLAGFTTKDLFELHQQEQIREFNKLATAIPEGDAVFDGYGHPMTHPHPLYYTSWVATLQYRQNNGYLDWNPEEEFQKHNIRWVIRDNRIRKLEGEVDRVIREKYKPSGFMEYVWERQSK